MGVTTAWRRVSRAVRASVLGLGVSGIVAGAAAAQSSCLPEGLYLEESLPYVRGDGTPVPGKQELVEYREFDDGTVEIGDMRAACLGGTLAAHEIYHAGRSGWIGTTPPDPVIAEINALQLPRDLSGTINADGRSGLVGVTQYWFHWVGEELRDHSRYARQIKFTRLDERLLLLRDGVEPVELTPDGPPVELPSDKRFALEIEILNTEVLPRGGERWIDFAWTPGISQTGAEQFTYDSRAFNATVSGKAKLRTKWLTPKIVTQTTPEEWSAMSGLFIQPGQTVLVGLSSWDDGWQPLIFTQAMPEPKELYFVRILNEAEQRIDPATAMPGDDLRVVAVYDSDVAMDTGSVLLRSEAETLSVSVTRVADDPRTFKSGIIRIQEAPVKAAAEDPTATDPGGATSQ